MNDILLYKPVTPSRREFSSSNKKLLWKGSPNKSLVKKIQRSSGRNNHGVITVRHRSSGHKKAYRIIDFKRKNYDIPANVERIEYDPYRSSSIALIKYKNGQYSYILAPDGLSVGSEVISSKTNPVISIGNSFPLSLIPLGSSIHNVELKPGSGGIIARSAGCSAQLMGKSSGYCTLRMQSGEIRIVNSECMATIGVIGNQYIKNLNLGKAGRSRWMGVRPTVRGVAMNPVDHPHGGGEGKTSGGRHPVSPTGRVTKGQKTRKTKFSSSKILQNRRGK